MQVFFFRTSPKRWNFHWGFSDQLPSCSLSWWHCG